MGNLALTGNPWSAIILFGIDSTNNKEVFAIVVGFVLKCGPQGVLNIGPIAVVCPVWSGYIYLRPDQVIRTACAAKHI